jgi:predicted metal-dependent HD superfamily phosphohydrolase
MSDFQSPSRYATQWSALIRTLIDASQRVADADGSVQRKYADIQHMIGNTLAGLPVIARIRQLLHITPNEEMALWLAVLVELDPQLTSHSSVWPLQQLTIQAVTAIEF